MVQFVAPVLSLAALALAAMVFGCGSSSLLSVMLPAIVHARLYALIWWLYLSRSHRAKRTYELQLRESGAPAAADEPVGA